MPHGGESNVARLLAKLVGAIDTIPQSHCCVLIHQPQAIQPLDGTCVQHCLPVHVCVVGGAGDHAILDAISSPPLRDGPELPKESSRNLLHRHNLLFPVVTHTVPDVALGGVFQLGQGPEALLIRQSRVIQRPSQDMLHVACGVCRI
mmetsp:Transcript_47153/g.102629  ORF Transcript_47153/g.102629 Transcript_47153/m.102629 type:complete len:147 (+) Transcript_47153:2571-3011(+)